MEHEPGAQHRLRHARLGSVRPAAAQQLRDGEVERPDWLQLKKISKKKDAKKLEERTNGCRKPQIDTNFMNCGTQNVSTPACCLLI